MLPGRNPRMWTRKCGHERSVEDQLAGKPCSQKVTKALPCGHEVSAPCSYRNPKCQTKVTKEFHCGHIAEATCGQKECPIRIKALLPCGHEGFSGCGKPSTSTYTCPLKISHKLPCGHEVITCKTKGLKCRKKITKKLACGHSASVCCSDETEICPNLLVKESSCGHIIGYQCGTPVPKCRKSVSTILPCGHLVTSVCGEEILRCALCKVSTTLSCGHTVFYDFGKSKPTICTEIITKKLPCSHVVEYPCGQICPPCTYATKIMKNCGHEVLLNCGKRFVPTCTQMINKVLPCGHKVMYRCGQECPPCAKAALTRRKCGHNVSVTCNGTDLPTVHCEVKCKKMCKRGHLCLKYHDCLDDCPPCNAQVCFTFGSCEHKLEIPCFEGDSDNSKICKSLCTRPRKCTHPCTLQCGLHRNGICPPCEVYVKRTRTCGHQMTALCQTEVNLEKCMEKVNASSSSSCGHKIEIECHLEENLEDGEAILQCGERCGFYFDPKDGGCGHYCSGTCKSCAEDRFHKQCLEKCRKILFCGHQCVSRCSSTCLPCSTRCESLCEHGSCDHICSTPCIPCKEPCTYGCPHGNCTNKCGQICNKKLCQEKCPKKLKRCGHLCAGFCGEPCPNLCTLCDSEELLKVCYDGSTAIEQTTRFILLLDCGHCIDAESMDRLMKVSVVDGEIARKRCPLCRDAIRRCKRYSLELAKVKEDVEKVKKLVYGDRLDIHRNHAELSKSIFTLCAYDWKSKKSDKNIYVLLKEKLLDHLFHRDTDGRVMGFKEMSLEASHTLSFVTKIFVQSLILLKRAVENIPKNWSHHFTSCLSRIISFLTERPWPLTPFERKALDREWLRVISMAELYNKLSKAESQVVQRLLLQARVQDVFFSAHEAINPVGPYDGKAEARFAEALASVENALQCKIGISEAERMDIIKAFDYSTGRWFKCPNGHVYVVTECGGVTEEGVCNECGAKIGGRNHSVLATNELATEMDGATRPLYPTALNRL